MKLATQNHKLVTFLWFEKDAAPARDFYCGIFPGSTKGQTTYYGDGAPMPKGTVLTAEFSLFGVPFIGLNGGGAMTPTPAVSFSVGCDSQAEIDRYWDGLADGGKPMQCGWITDRYGFAWQIVPAKMGEWMSDPALAPRLMQAFMPMVKLDMEVLRRLAEEK
jgi:predicted 3-demethylubiquinone-9 3-methyltransferase (glyoxalase superfamily)